MTITKQSDRVIFDEGVPVRFGDVAELLNKRFFAYGAESGEVGAWLTEHVDEYRDYLRVCLIEAATDLLADLYRTEADVDPEEHLRNVALAQRVADESKR